MLPLKSTLVTPVLRLLILSTYELAVLTNYMRFMQKRWNKGLVIPNNLTQALNAFMRSKLRPAHRLFRVQMVVEALQGMVVTTAIPDAKLLLDDSRVMVIEQITRRSFTWKILENPRWTVELSIVGVL